MSFWRTLLSPTNTVENDAKVVKWRSNKRNKKPSFVYNMDERRVIRYLSAVTNGSIGNTIGYGVDPIGSLIASHASLLYKVESVKE